MKLKKILAGLLLGLVMGATALTKQPTFSQAAGQGAEFSVKPILPPSQKDQQLSHFELTPTPGAEYPLKVVVENLSTTQTRQFQVQLVTATTASSGKIDYTPSTQKRDGSAAVVLPELAKNQATNRVITLAPASQQTVTFDLTAPQPAVPGTILGSIYVKRIDPPATNQQQIGLQNEFAMTIPVLLNTPTAMQPKLAIDQVKLTTVGGAAELVAAVHNRNPIMFGQIQMAATVHRRGQQQALIHQVDQNYEMAPNSILPYRLETGGKTLAPGKYVLDLKMTSGTKSFDLQKEFVIKNQDQAAAEQHLVEINRQTPTHWGIILASLAILATVIGLIIWLMRRRQQK